MNNSLIDQSPVFVVSPVRSGSTVLRLMLDGHPQISNPGECDFLFDMVGNKGEFPEKHGYADWLSSDRIFQATRIQVNPDLQYLELMRTFLQQMSRKDAVLSMNIHRNFHRVPHVFPNARYVRLLRDPRDVARSCIGMGWVGHVYYGVDTWSQAEESWQRLKSRLAADQYLEIRYEDLVNDFKDVLGTICHFLGLEYSDQMMAYASTSTYALPDNSLSYQWKKKYTKRELQLVEGKVGQQILDLGYELSGHDPAKPGLFEKFLLYAGNKKYRVLHQVNRYGFGLYVENLLASKMGARAWRLACQQRKNKIDLEHVK